MARRAPLFTEVYGLQNFVVNEERSLGGGESQIQSLEENTFTFTLLASAVHIGVKILESPEGRRALQQVGQEVVTAWAQRRRYTFEGDVRRMPEYVDHFLCALRADFPQITVSDLGGPDVIAQANRMTPIPGYTWDRNLFAYTPKSAVGMFFNHRRVADMNANASLQGTTPSDAPAYRGRAKKYKEFLFMFAIATVHELTHAFVGYLSKNESNENSYTPPDVSYLNYAGYNDGTGGDNGESGRRLESLLFGGSLEWYRNPDEDPRQVGMAHVLDHNALAYPISHRTMAGMVESSNNFVFPLPTGSRGLSDRRRAEMGLYSLGRSGNNVTYEPQALQMRARRNETWRGDPRRSDPRRSDPRRSGHRRNPPRRTGPILAYNITFERLRQIALGPTQRRAQRVR